jgi:hypothetical protein
MEMDDLLLHFSGTGNFTFKTERGKVDILLLLSANRR